MAIKMKMELKKQGRPFPHYWEFCVGSCHAATLLREDVRQQIRTAHAECGFRYLRFHGLFDDDMSVVIRPMIGMPEISFYNIDCIFDFLLEIGMKPFIELGFMPDAMASGSQTCFHYKGNVTMPKSDEEWQDFIRQFVSHLLERYGEEEVESWFFEVWNEPNLNFFFDGTQEDYFHLYEITAKAIKSVNQKVNVGGPSTSVNAWIPEFRDFCEENKVPLDFITTHHYPSDDPLSTMGMNGPGVKGQSIDDEQMKQLQTLPPEELEKVIAAMFVPKENRNPRNILQIMAQKAKEEAGDYPLYYTEWNGSIEHDTNYQAAIVAQTLAYNENLVEGYSFWTVSDIFEEMGLFPEPFKDAFGMMTNHGVRKPVYRVFQTLHEAGDTRLEVRGGSQNVEALALTDGNETVVLVYNHDLERHTVKTETVEFTVYGRVRGIQKAVIDEENCNPKKAWECMGSPKYLKRSQISTLHEASELKYQSLTEVNNVETTITFEAAPESVTILRILNA